MRRRIALLSRCVLVAGIVLGGARIVVVGVGYQSMHSLRPYRAVDLLSSTVLHALRRGQIVAMRGILTPIGPNLYQLTDPPATPSGRFTVDVVPGPPTPLLSSLVTVPGVGHLLPATADHPHIGTVRVYQLTLLACPSHPVCDTPVEWELHSGG